MPTIDSIAPAYIGEDLIRLQLNESTRKPRVGQPVIVQVDYSASFAHGGVSLPVERIIQGPLASDRKTHIYRRFRPSILTFVPTIPGEHLVLLRELHHNLFVGMLTLQVAG